jgi:hypothetical protein
MASSALTETEPTELAENTGDVDINRMTRTINNQLGFFTTNTPYQ